MIGLSKVQLYYENKIQLLKQEYIEFTSMRNRNVISAKDYIVVARQITVEIMYFTDKFVNSNST